MTDLVSVKCKLSVDGSYLRMPPGLSNVVKKLGMVADDLDANNPGN